MFKMFFAKTKSDGDDVPTGETNVAGAAVLVLLLLAVTALGVAMPEGLKSLIQSAADIVKGVRA